MGFVSETGYKYLQVTGYGILNINTDTIMVFKLLVEGTKTCITIWRLWLILCKIEKIVDRI
jgi:hypothetical protein